jgi:hypothetical protein
MGSSGGETGSQTAQAGLPKKQNKDVLGAIGNQNSVYNQGAPQINSLAQPAGISPNSSGLTMNAPLYGGSFNPIAPTGAASNGQPPTNASFPQQGGQGGTPSSALPTQGGGPANSGALGNQYAENVLSGQYLNPSSNPYLQASMAAADQPTIQAYETAIAPSTNAQFAMADNFGPSSSAYNNAVSGNEFNLANELGNMNSNMAENAYNTGISQQNTIAALLPQIQQSQFGPAQQPLNYANTYNSGLMGLVSPYSYNQGTQSVPNQGMTPGQGVGAGVGLLGLAGLI